MIDLRKALWGSALLVAFGGCNTEEPAGTNPPPPPPTVPGAPPGEVTPPPAEKPKEDLPPAKPDETKPEAPKEDVKLEAPKAEAPKEEPAPAPKKEEEKKADASPVKETLSSEELAQIEKLPAGEKEIALAQLVCPVSGEHLGSMGKPIKLTAEGKTFLICCKGCTEDVEKDPKAVVAKLNKK